MICFFKLAAASAVATMLAACGGGSDGYFDAGSALTGSHLYTQTNETQNHIIHYARKKDGTLVEVERVGSGGMGTNGAKPLTGASSEPDSLTSAGAVAINADHTLLFGVNAGDASVSSFAIGIDGKLALRDRQPTGERGAPSSLTFNQRTQTLYVLHTQGPNHIRTFKVVDGKLMATGNAYTVNTAQFGNRVATQIISSPDDRFVLVDVLFNAPPKVENGAVVLTPSNAGTKDGVMVFPVNADGSLGDVVANDAGGPTPFSLAFVRGSHNTFVNTLAAGNGVVLSTLDANGNVSSSPVAKVDLSAAPNKGPSETCWVSLSPDNRYAYATNFGLGNITSFSIENGAIRTAADNLGLLAGDGSYKSAAGVLTSGPVDSWAGSDGYLYQLYPNAQQLVAYRMNGATLEKIGSYPVPHNSPMGMVGF